MSKKTTEQIVTSGNDYLVKVKRNQRVLLKEMQRVHCNSQSLEKFITTEKNRGRKESRLIHTYTANEFIKTNWSGAQTIVYVKRQRKTKKGTSVTHSYYLSSMLNSAQEFAKGIRHHWGIENRLHYVKDVTLKEDESRIRSGNAPQILSLIRNLVINVARINGENSVKKFTRQCAGNLLLITKLLE